MTKYIAILKGIGGIRHGDHAAAGAAGPVNQARGGIVQQRAFELEAHGASPVPSRWRRPKVRSMAYPIRSLNALPAAQTTYSEGDMRIPQCVASVSGGSMIVLSPDISPEVTVLVRAQQVVDRWRHAAHGGDFAGALTRAMAEPGDDFMAMDNHRLAVQRVAEAIHAGVGHGFHDQEPLLAIAQAAFQES